MSGSMDDSAEGPFEDADLRYTCPTCRRIFAKPTANWLCPSCKGTLRVLGALRLRDKRRGSPPDEDSADEELPSEDEEDSANQ